MAENKTQITNVDPMDFIAAVEHPTRRADAEVLVELMQRVTGCKPKMWGPSIIGFGRYHYTYDSGREGDFLITGFSPRKSNLSVYIMPGYTNFQEQLDRLGKHKTAKSCLYINKLADIDLDVLEELVAAGVAEVRKTHEAYCE